MSINLVPRSVGIIKYIQMFTNNLQYINTILEISSIILTATELWEKTKNSLMNSSVLYLFVTINIK